MFNITGNTHKMLHCSISSESSYHDETDRLGLKTDKQNGKILFHVLGFSRVRWPNQELRDILAYALVCS